MKHAKHIQRSFVISIYRSIKLQDVNGHVIYTLQFPWAP